MGTEKRARQKELHKTRAEEARKAAEAQARKKRLVNYGLLGGVIVIIIGAILFSQSGSDSSTTNAASKPTTTVKGAPTTTAKGGPTTTLAAGTSPCPAADGSSPKKRTFDGPPKMCIDPAKTYTAKVETNKGDFTITLDPAKAPLTANNFVFLARYHFFDGIIFHRIIKDFVIQGGDPQGTGTGGPGYQFADELPKAGEYQKYSLAMANSGPNTNGSQFFVITGPQGQALPPQYSLFGKVTDGTAVVDAIGTVKTAQGDRPVDEVKMNKVTITES